MRPRDPRRLLERSPRTRARVAIVRVPQSGASEDGAVGSKQVAEVTLPRAELEKIWSPEYLERLARTYWSFLSRFSLGLIRVLYSDDSREVVFLTRPFVLLRFQQAGVRDRRRRRHGHLAHRPRRAGGEARPRTRLPAAGRATRAGGGRRRRGDPARLVRGRELLSDDRDRPERLDLRADAATDPRDRDPRVPALAREPRPRAVPRRRAARGRGGAEAAITPTARQ